MGKAVRWRSRRAKAADHPAILRLAKSQMDAVLMDAWGVPVNPDDLFGSKEVELYILETPAGKMIGFYGLILMTPTLHVHTLVLDAAVQGRGLGTSVMNAIDEEAVKRGCNAVELCVQTTNPRAIRLYERLGYASYGLVFISTLLMHKDLPPLP